MRFYRAFVLLLVCVVFSTLFIATLRKSNWDGGWLGRAVKQAPKQSDMYVMDIPKRKVDTAIRKGHTITAVPDNRSSNNSKINGSVDLDSKLQDIQSDLYNEESINETVVNIPPDRRLGDLKVPDDRPANISADFIPVLSPPKSDRIVEELKAKATVTSRPPSCQPRKSLQLMENLFGKKFNASIDPFLSRQALLSRHVNTYPLPFGLRNREFDYSRAMVDRIKDMGLPRNIPKSPCRRCIVVGNGGLLRDANLGKEIDSYDVVIRMNLAPTKGFEEDVGSKTTIRMLYPESSGLPVSEYRRKGWTLLVIPFKLADIQWAEYIMEGRDLRTLRGYWAPVATDVPKDKEEVRILNPEITYEAATNLIGFDLRSGKQDKNVPTSGVMAIMISLRICDEVAVAGFGYDMSKPTALLHYYNRAEKMDKMKHSFTHNLSPERIMLRDLVDKGIITDLTNGLR